jgi:hypothetical protein
LEGRRLSVGTVRGLTILVEFQDVTTTVTRAEVEEMLNGQNYSRNGNFCSVREYFRLVSVRRECFRGPRVGGSVASACNSSSLDTGFPGDAAPLRST